MAQQGNLSDAEWKARLTSVQYEVLRLKGTEPAGTGEYDKHFDAGTYVCSGCRTPLYTSDTKFDSGCGWPAFYDVIPNAIKASDVAVAQWTCFGAAALLTLCHCAEKPCSRRPKVR